MCSLAIMEDALLDALNAAIAEHPIIGFMPSQEYWESCRVVARRFLDHRDRFLTEHRGAQRNEREAIDDRWGPALDTLELHWLLCRSLGIRQDWESTRAGVQDAPQRIAERQLFWTAHHIGAEVLVLLRAGLPAGALARWRALCELDIRAVVVHRGDDEVAEAYLEHERLRLHSEIQLLQAAERAEGGEGIERAVMALFEQERRDVHARREISKDDQTFSGDYGWAHRYLLAEDPRYVEKAQAGQRPRGPLFDDLLRYVEWDPDDQHPIRYRYAAASAAVHGAPRAAADYDPEGELVPWAGPAITDIGFPASCLAVSLTRIADTYIWWPPSGDVDETTDHLTGPLDQLGAIVLELVAAAEDTAP